MLIPNSTSIYSTDTSLAGIGRSAERTQSLGSLFDRTDNTDRFQPSLFSNSSLSGMYTAQGIMASPFASLQSVFSFSSTGSGMTASAINAYQSQDTSTTTLGGSFPSPLATTARQAAVQTSNLFDLQFSAPGGTLDLLA